MKLSTSQFQIDGGGPGLAPSAAVEADASASPASVAAIANNRMAQASYSGSTGSTGGSAPKSVDKSGYNRNIKVSQAVVDSTKDLGRGNMGVKAAQDALAIKPRVIGGVLSSGPVAASREQKEATKRVYPNAYKSAAGTNFKSSPGPSDIAKIKR